jgi:hypothetical protein
MCGRRIRLHWPHTRITIRGDGHYGRHEMMSWCEASGLKYIFGLSGKVILDKSVEPFADDIRVRRAEAQARLDILRTAKTAETDLEFLQASAQARAVRGHVEVSYGAKSCWWPAEVGGSQVG